MDRGRHLAAGPAGPSRTGAAGRKPGTAPDDPGGQRPGVCKPKAGLVVQR